MTRVNPQLTNKVEHYLSDIARQRASGGATGERSRYPALVNLLDAVGRSLKPKVFCVSELADQGAGHPDIGLYSAKQVQKGRPRSGQIPERGVVEVKPDEDELEEVTTGEQVARYWSRYRLVLVTNLREFRLVGPDAARGQTTLEAFRLADTARDFHRKLEKPRAFSREVGARLVEYLGRALSHRAALTEPKDLAWLLASYARDGLSRVETAGDIPAFDGLRSGLEDALGIRFEGERGKRFFHSTLVQTLFYGVFSAWVLWARSAPSKQDLFDWKTADWHLRNPVLRSLFHQMSDPGRLQPLGLVEVLDWTSAALDRVDRKAFFARFREGEAVQYFYEPFLAAFDPELRKRLGVWYTPNEVVRYMVARVDRALKDDLGIADGLAAENVYVLDPCCGTGAYLAEVLRRIGSNLGDKGLGALVGSRVKEAATQRVFGFEIMPAPFVVAHLQVGLTMQDLEAPLSDDGTERAQVFLTNALTGWEQKADKPLLFPELAEERERAQRVKQRTPILVIVGNPPYDGFAGVAMEEEQALLEAYRVGKRVQIPDTRGLHDPYVRFFRMAERRIAEKTGEGVICFISNSSWLDGVSFAGMREKYLDDFDVIRVDCLNGDIRAGGRTPSGDPDPSIFSTPGQSAGIRVGTAITTLVRKTDHTPAATVAFRHLWGKEKRSVLVQTSEEQSDVLYEDIEPALPLGLPFLQTDVCDEWFEWPSLLDLLPIYYCGINTNRDNFLVDTDIDQLRARITDYFDSDVTYEEIARLYPHVARTTARFDARTTREVLLRRGRDPQESSGPTACGFVRYTHRPFDNRWLYWEKETKLLNEKRPDYRPHVFESNLWLSAVPRLRKDATEPQAVVTSHLASLHLVEWGANMFPAWLQDTGLSSSGDATARRPNLTVAARRYLDHLGLGVDDLFHHTLAVLHHPEYRTSNAGALRMGWPRVPLPGWPDGNADDAQERLSRSATRGRKLGCLLDPDVPVSGVTVGRLRGEIASLAVPTTVDGSNMASSDFAVTTGWGHYGSGDAVMPGTGRAVHRSFTAAEHATLAGTLPTLGDATFDIWLNDRAFWRNVPAAVWNYRLGGYPVLKKWLSYRERSVLHRPLRPEEVQHFTDTTRRIAAILLLTQPLSAAISGGAKDHS